MTPYFFGYGSLVNLNTHTYPDAQPATLRGWRRAWVRTDQRDVVFLTVIQDAETTIDGVIAAVPNADWLALDAREYGYARHSSGGAVSHDLTPAPDIAHYAIPPENTGRSGDHVILLSYLDVVVQGFLKLYGEAGAKRFFDTTNGWDTPILNDRLAPIYPRHQRLSKNETALVDDHLTRLSARVEQRHQAPLATKDI
ncbi:MAG: gamma-glutamylcyclotransferase family protein [Sulfitobacter sp.]